MKTKTTLFFTFLFAFQLSAQKGEDFPASTFALVTNYDNMFGFYPAAYGSFGVKENLSFTYYGMLWTNPSFGSPQTGTDSWLETGFGLSTALGGGKWLLNPSLGITHGKLLSGGEEGVIAEGIAPSMTVLFQDGVMELEAFGVWYKALRREGLFNYDYALYWFLPGFIINDHISAGLHFEGFVQTRASIGETGHLYQAVGAYAKFTVGGRYAFRFSLGKNFQDSGYPDDFYKVSVVVPML